MISDSSLSLGKSKAYQNRFLLPSSTDCISSYSTYVFYLIIFGSEGQCMIAMFLIVTLFIFRAVVAVSIKHG